MTSSARSGGLPGPGEYGAICRLLILTGSGVPKSRKRHGPRLTWPRGPGRLPAARAKNGRAHSVPLSDAALAIFESLPRGDGNFAVFQPVSFSREKAKLDAAMGNFPSPWGIFPSPGRFTTYAARPRPAWRALAPRRM